MNRILKWCKALNIGRASGTIDLWILGCVFCCLHVYYVCFLEVWCHPQLAQLSQSDLLACQSIYLHTHVIQEPIGQSNRWQNTPQTFCPGRWLHLVARCASHSEKACQLAILRWLCQHWKILQPCHTWGHLFPQYQDFSRGVDSKVMQLQARCYS